MRSCIGAGTADSDVGARNGLRRSGNPRRPLWWVTEDDRPDADAAMLRLEYLRAHGPSPRAFSLRRRFDPAGEPVRPRRR